MKHHIMTVPIAVKFVPVNLFGVDRYSRNAFTFCVTCLLMSECLSEGRAEVFIQAELDIERSRGKGKGKR